MSAFIVVNVLRSFETRVYREQQRYLSFFLKGIPNAHIFCFTWNWFKVGSGVLRVVTTSVSQKSAASILKVEEYQTKQNGEQDFLRRDAV
jgi:hypothetical protein